MRSFQGASGSISRLRKGKRKPPSEICLVYQVELETGIAAGAADGADVADDDGCTAAAVPVDGVVVVAGPHQFVIEAVEPSLAGAEAAEVVDGAGLML